LRVILERINPLCLWFAIHLSPFTFTVFKRDRWFRAGGAISWRGTGRLGQLWADGAVFLFSVVRESGDAHEVAAGLETKAEEGQKEAGEVTILYGMPASILYEMLLAEINVPFG
jgi:hypothetical protein